MRISKISLLIPLSLAACASGAAGTEAHPAATIGEVSVGSRTAASAESADVESRAAVRAARFAFRREGEAFRGVFDAYVAERGARDGLALTPVRTRSLPLDTSSQDKDSTASSLPIPSRAERVSGAPLVLAPTSIERAGSALLDSSANAELRIDGHIGIGTSSVHETLENTEAGVEQSWTFQERPAGDGDLTVTIAVTGERFVAHDRQGLHFADPASGLGFVYGNATWIDASGSRRTVTPTYEDGHIVIRVPSAVADGAQYPVVLDPTIGPEIAVGMPIDTLPAITPDIAYDPSSGRYLATWIDKTTTTPRLMGALIDATKGLLTPAGFFLPPRTSSRGQQSPRVAVGSNGFLVVWEEAYSTSDHDIEARFVKADGSVGAAIDIDRTADFSAKPAVVSAGDKYVVAYESGAGPVVRASTLGSTGSIVVNQLQISSRTTGNHDVALDFDGANVLVAWKTNSATAFGYRHLVGSTGVPTTTDSQDWILASEQNGACVFQGDTIVVRANDGLNFWMGAQEKCPTIVAGTGGFFMAKVANDGTYPASSQVIANTNGYSYSGVELSPISSAPGTYSAVWQDMYGNSSFGTVSLVSYYNYAPYVSFVTKSTVISGQARLASDGYQIDVVISDGGTYGLKNQVLKLDGSQGTGFNGKFPADHGGSITGLTSATDGTSSLLLWSDDANGIRNIYMTGVYANGIVAWPGGTLASTTTIAGRRSRPAVAYGSNGTSSYYLAVWQNDTTGQIEYSRIYPGGGKAIEGGIPLGTGVMPRVAWNGQAFVVTWKTTSAMANDSLFAQRITLTGVVYPAKLVTHDLAGAEDIACIPNVGCSIVFESNHAGMGTNGGWSGVARFGMNEEVPDLAAAKVACNPGWVAYTYSPKIAASSSSYMVVCEEPFASWDYSTGGTTNYYYVLFQALDAAANMTGQEAYYSSQSFTASQSPTYDAGRMPKPRVAFDGTDFVMVFDRASSSACSATPASHDRYVQHVSPMAALIGSPTLVQSGVTIDWEDSSITGASAGRTVLIPYLKDGASCGVPAPYVYARFQTP